MQWTGNVGRTFGQALLALGIIAVVVGVLGLVFGGLILRDAAKTPEMQHGDLGDLLDPLIFGGGGLVAFGTGAVVLAIVILGFARALRERLQRKAAASAVPAAPAPTP